MPSDTRSNGTAQHNEAPSAPAMLVRSAQPGDASEPGVSIGLAYAPYSGTESSGVRIPHDWSGCENGERPQQHLGDWGTGAKQNRRTQLRQLAAVLESIKCDTSAYRLKRPPSDRADILTQPVPTAEA
jgi:hypothetical protein